MKNFIHKIIRTRKHLIKSGKSQKGAMAEYALAKVELWLSFWDKQLDDEKVKKYCQRHRDLIMAIMPGRTSPSGEALQKEFNQLINQ